MKKMIVIFLMVLWMQVAGFAAAGSDILWRFDTGKPYNSSLTTAAVGEDGTVFVANDHGEVFALNSDGQVKWVYTIPSDEFEGRCVISTPVVRGDGMVYVTVKKKFEGYLYVLNGEGKKEWVRHFAGEGVVSAPTLLADGTAYVGSGWGILYALGSGGNELWQYETAGAIKASPVVGAKGVIYVGNTKGEFLALWPSGTKKWVIQLEGEITVSPRVGADGRVYVASGNTLSAVSSQGEKIWVFQTLEPISASPAVGQEGMIYIPTEDGDLFALAPDGSQKWVINLREDLSTPIIDSKGVIYLRACSTLYAINTDGSEKWRVDADSFTPSGSRLNPSPVWGEDGKIYLGMEDDHLYAFQMWEKPDGAPINDQELELQQQAKYRGANAYYNMGKLYEARANWQMATVYYEKALWERKHQVYIDAWERGRSFDFLGGSNGELRVRNGKQLLQAIGSNRVIVLLDGNYDFSEVTDVENKHISWRKTLRGVEPVIRGVENLVITGQERMGEMKNVGKNQDDVLSFVDCRGITLEYLKISSEWPGRSLISFKHSQDITIKNVILIGGRNDGLYLQGVKNLELIDSTITQCDDGAVTAMYSSNLRFLETEFIDNKWAMYFADSSGILFSDILLENGPMSTKNKFQLIFVNVEDAEIRDSLIRDTNGTRLTNEPDLIRLINTRVESSGG